MTVVLGLLMMWIGWAMYKDKTEGFFYILGKILWWSGAAISILGIILLIIIANIDQ